MASATFFIEEVFEGKNNGKNLSDSPCGCGDANFTHADGRNAVIASGHSGC